MAGTEIQLDREALRERYQPLIDNERFSRRQVFEIYRDILAVRETKSVALDGPDINVDIDQPSERVIQVTFIRIDSLTYERWEISSHPTEQRGRQRFTTTFYFASGMQVSLVVGEVSRIGQRIHDIDLKLNETHLFKLAKAGWDAHLNTP